MNKPLLLTLITTACAGTCYADQSVFSFLVSTSGIFGTRYGSIPQSGWGYWGEMKFNAPSHSPSYETISRRTVETVFKDPFREEVIQHFNVGAGATLAITETFSLYGGAGWAVETPWRRYFDSTGILGGNPGDYWIRDDERNSVNFCAGLTFGIAKTASSNIYASLGAETRPRGIVFGVGAGF